MLGGEFLDGNSWVEIGVRIEFLFSARVKPEEEGEEGVGEVLEGIGSGKVCFGG